MSERIKLQNPGESYAMQILSVSVEKVSDTDYAKFDDGDKELLVPLKSVERQLERIGVGTVKEMVGQPVRFSRSEEKNKYGKLYWNLDPATTSDLKPTPAPKRIQGPGPSETDLPGDPASNWAPRDVPDPEDYPIGGPAVLADEAERPEKADPKREARRRSYAALKALWRDAAAFQREVCAGIEGGGQYPPIERIPFDANSINQMVATAWIGWDKRGIQP